MSEYFRRVQREGKPMTSSKSQGIDSYIAIFPPEVRSILQKMGNDPENGA
jgi:hypothetical protein